MILMENWLKKQIPAMDAFDSQTKHFLPYYVRMT